MMDLSTSYLGFDLPHPLMPGASPLVDDLDTVRRLEDAGVRLVGQKGGRVVIVHELMEPIQDLVCEVPRS